jgi:hypothetical protein
MGITQGQIGMFFACSILDLSATSNLISAMALPPGIGLVYVYRIRSSHARSMLDGDMERVHAVNGTKHGKYVSKTLYVQLQLTIDLEC